MKRKFWTILLTLVAALSLCFAFTACDETKNGGTADNNSQTEQSGGSQGGDQGGGTQKPDGGSQNDQGGTQGATHTHQFSSSWSSDDATHWHAATCGHSVKQGESAHTYVNGICSTCNHAHVNHSYGNWRTVEDATCTKAGMKQRECSCGAVQTESIPQKDHSYANSVCTVCGAVEPGAIEVKVYIDNILKETLYTNSSKGYKVVLPAKPEDMTTDPELKNYFDGWYADKNCTTPLTGEETYSTSSAIYGRNIVNKGWGCKYEVNNGNVTITALIATSPTPSTDVVVPAYFNSFPVTKIGNNAAKDLSMIRNLYLCKNLKEIGDCAFYNCNSMQKVALPSSLISIGGCAFEGCSSLQSIEIPDSVTSIGGFAFEGCSSLQSIEIPEGVTSIGSEVFSGCNKLTSVIWNAENCTTAGSSSYPIFKGCTSLKTVTFGKTVETIPAYAFSGRSGLTGALKIPDSVTSIGDEAFSGCSGLTGALKIPDNVTSIGSSAFYGCSGLTGALKISDNVTSIGSYAFSGCSGLESVTIGNGVTSIGSYAFSGCSGLESATIGNGVTSIGSDAFSGCSGLTSVTIGSGVTLIGSYAFYNCSGLKNVYYKGTPSEWSDIRINSYNSSLIEATRYYFSAQAPSAEQWQESKNWWHYAADGTTIVLWTKES